MRVALVGAELEENLGLRYIASALERDGHDVEVVAFNSDADHDSTTARVTAFNPDIVGLSMVFTGRAREFCRLASGLRTAGFAGHMIAGGHFASLNCEQLLADVAALDSIALGEGERTACDVARSLDDLRGVPGLCFRAPDGTITTTAQSRDGQDLDALPYPKRSAFHTYFDKPIASVLTSRGCWRSCAFCSIDAWYQQVGGTKFRVRSLDSIVDELTRLYDEHGVRIFNFQDDNFFLPNPRAATARFEELRRRLHAAGVANIAIAVKARPDSITRDAISVLDQLGLFRVFLGVENASENGLSNLNRRQTVDEILNALTVLNDFDVHVAYNLLMFEPETTMDDILLNLRFMERHLDNPTNFCRAECYAGTGLYRQLASQGRLLGDYWGYDYRLSDPRSEAFHQIANIAFFDRNFNNNGLHYFNMQVDFYFQLLRRFYPRVLTETLRGWCRSFIKETNLDTHRHLCRIFDFVSRNDPHDQTNNRFFAEEIRREVDASGEALYRQGEDLLDWLTAAQEGRTPRPLRRHAAGSGFGPDLATRPVAESPALAMIAGGHGGSVNGLPPPSDGVFGPLAQPIPYSEFRGRIAELGHEPTPSPTTSPNP